MNPDAPRPRIPIAFFDVDHTVVRGSTAFHCAAILLREGVLRRADLLRIGWYHLRHHLGVMDAEAVYREGVRPFVGMDFAKGQALLDECFRDHVRPRVFREALEAMARHRAEGTRVVLLSASSAWLLERFRDFAPVDDVIAFRQRVVDGAWVNDWDRPIPYGRNKRVLALAYADARGVDLRDCAFYSDGISDRPLLEAVGHPVAVNPDPRLRWVAWRRGWPVVRWERLSG